MWETKEAEPLDGTIQRKVENWKEADLGEISSHLE